MHQEQGGRTGKLHVRHAIVSHFDETSIKWKPRPKKNLPPDVGTMWEQNRPNTP
jgi:hypothetical protein